jgi:hypothetical protein
LAGHLSRLKTRRCVSEMTTALAKLRHTFVVADATQPDCPLVRMSMPARASMT